MHIPGYKNLNQEERKITPTIRISRMIFVGFFVGFFLKGVKDFSYHTTCIEIVQRMDRVGIEVSINFEVTWCVDIQM